MAKEKIIYSAEERKKLLDYWNANKANPPSLDQLVNFLSDGQSSDPRSSPWGFKTRMILAEAKIKAKNKGHEKSEGETFIILTDSQKEFVRNNCKDNSPYEMGKVLFPTEGKLQPLGKEVRAITNYLKEIGEYVVKKDEGTIPDGRYEPPRTFHAILAKVNEYLHQNLSTQSITAFEKECLETTINFLHSPRFVQEINNYTTKEKRISFESEFIRAVYFKPDLTPEEISLTINACSDVIQAGDLKKQLEKLNQILNDTAESAIGEEKARLSMSLSDTIGKVTTHLNEVLKRQERLYAILNKKRSDRKQDKDNKVGSLTALFEWATEETNRKKLIEKAKLQEKLREQEINRQETLDDIILMSLGMKREEGIK